MVKCLPAMRETWVRSLGGEDPLEKEMATHSSTLAWKIPWTEEPCRLQSMGSQRDGHDLATSLTQQLIVELRTLRSRDVGMCSEFQSKRESNHVGVCVLPWLFIPISSDASGNHTMMLATETVTDCS